MIRSARTVFRAFVFISLAALSSCAMTPARRVIGQGTFAADLSVSAVLVTTEFTRLVPNISFSLVYGVTDNLNAGVAVSPGLLFLEKTLLAEPYLVWRALRQHGTSPAVSLYGSVPLLFSFEELSVHPYPMLGILPRWDFAPVGFYAAAEAMLDRSWKDGSPAVKYNLRGGVELELSGTASLGVEGGVNALGSASELYGWRYGQPIFKFGVMLRQ